MTADDVLEAIQRANGKYPLIRELVLRDLEYVRGLDAPTRRIDGLLIGPRGTRTAIEVKVTKADFRRETEAKRRAWIKICHRFVYACPAGLIQPDEVPDGIGLWWVDDRGSLDIKKRCSVNKEPDHIPDHLFAALCFRLADRPRKKRRRR